MGVLLGLKPYPTWAPPRMSGGMILEALPTSSLGHTRALGHRPREGTSGPLLDPIGTPIMGDFISYGGRPYIASYGWVYVPKLMSFSLSKSPLRGMTIRVSIGGTLPIYIWSVYKRLYMHYIEGT